jgi:hypothetical protein
LSTARFVLITAAIAILTGAVLLVKAHQASPQVAAPAVSSSPAAVETALRRHLDRQYLSYRWVVCVPSNRTYGGTRISRCNVDFGDPHIVSYCVAIVGGVFLTDHENRALRCVPHW